MLTNKLLKTILIIFLLTIIVALASATYYFFRQNRLARQSQTTSSDQETELLVGKVSQLMVLPDNETPSILTVEDKSKLQEQTFFTNAENGDKVLLYVKTNKAILYRPSLNKIIEVMAINFSNNTVKP